MVLYHVAYPYNKQYTRRRTMRARLCAVIGLVLFFSVKPTYAEPSFWETVMKQTIENVIRKHGPATMPNQAERNIQFIYTESYEIPRESWREIPVNLQLFCTENRSGYATWHLNAVSHPYNRKPGLSQKAWRYIQSLKRYVPQGQCTPGERLGTVTWLVQTDRIVLD